jgi:hypothetical protein
MAAPGMPRSWRWRETSGPFARQTRAMTCFLRSWIRAGLAAALVALALSSAGCSSNPGPKHAGPPKQPSKPPTPMAGQEIFFDGQVLAEINVGTEGVPAVAANGGNNRGAGGPRRHGGGNGQMSMGGGGGAYGGNVSGSVPIGAGGESRRGPGGAGGEGAGAGPHLSLGGGGPPMLIHLRFTNRGAAPVTVIIDDFSSPLGNFAVRPDRLTLAPGQTLETDPMASQLVGGRTEAVATLMLRVDGKAEKKSFPLKAVTVREPDQGTSP